MASASRFISHPSPKKRGLLQICADWQLITAISVTTLIVALNVSLPNLSSTESLSTYQTRLPTIQYSNPIPKFIYLSYLNPQNGLYFKGNDDIYYVAFWVLVWLSLRAVFMRWLWRPVGIACGLADHSPRLQRFAEQSWSLSYYTVFWCMGINILSRYPRPIYALDIRQYWAGYPHDSLPGLTKFYYLSQTAFWFQQMIVLNLEKHRKDHYQMLAHHIVTVSLVCVSYATNFTGIGSAIHTLMDLSDVFLSLAKILNYLGGGPACDVTFVAFVLSWIVTRHLVYGHVFWELYRWMPVDVPFGWQPERGYMASRYVWLFWLVMLGLLQVLLIVWLWQILRVVWRVIAGHKAYDSRSDSDDSEADGGARDEDEKTFLDTEPDAERVRLLTTPALEAMGDQMTEFAEDPIHFRDDDSCDGN